MPDADPILTENTRFHARLGWTLVTIAGIVMASITVWTWKTSIEYRIAGLDGRIADIPTRQDLRATKDEIKGTLRKQFRAARVVCPLKRGERCTLIIEDDE